MPKDIMSTIDELMYAKNPSYWDKLLMYEELIGLSKGEQREAYKQEYVDTITKYGSCTSLSFALTPSLANSQNHDILASITQNLDSGISQAETADTPCTEGETDMAKQLKERVEVGRDENGKPITKWATGHTRQEVLQSAARLLQPDKQPDVNNTISPLFSQWLGDYNAIYRRKLCGTTQSTYAQSIKKHINPSIGSMRLTEIDSGVIQRWFDDLCDDGKSAETIKKIRTIIKPAFDYAVDEGIIQRNPINKRVKINTKKGEHHKALPLEKSDEIKSRLNELTGRERVMMALLCYTGLRMGEALGLRWDDIDFVRKEIHLERGITHPTRNQPVVGAPKTENSIRTIPVAEQLIAILEPMRASGYVVSGEKPLTYEQQKRSWAKIAKHFHIDDYTPHDMRDTCATEWFEMGIPIAVVSKMLGHASIEITMRLYAKVRNKSTDEARKIMDMFYDKSFACDKQRDKEKAS